MTERLHQGGIDAMRLHRQHPLQQASLCYASVQIRLGISLMVSVKSTGIHGAFKKGLDTLEGVFRPSQSQTHPISAEGRDESRAVPYGRHRLCRGDSKMKLRGGEGTRQCIRGEAFRQVRVGRQMHLFQGLQIVVARIQCFTVTEVRHAIASVFNA